MGDKDTKSRRPPPRRTYSLRLREQERRLVETAALDRGQTLAEFIRRAATKAARRSLLTTDAEGE